MSIGEVIEAIQKGAFKRADTKYKEILRLDKMLSDENIPHELRDFWDGYQIEYPVSSQFLPDSKRVCSVIEHYGSYGNRDDLLEIMGLTENGEQVEGFLSAEEVFSRILAHHKSCDTKP